MYLLKLITISHNSLLEKKHVSIIRILREINISEKKLYNVIHRVSANLNPILLVIPLHFSSIVILSSFTVNI